MADFKDILFAFLTGSFLTTATWLYIFKHPEKVEKWGAIFFNLLNKIWKGSNYLTVKYDIQSKINSFVEEINDNSTTQFPKVVIEWAGKDDEEVIWEEGKIVLIMRDHKHKVKNFVSASHFFVSEMLLKKAKRHLSKNQKISIDLFATKKILEDQNPTALEYFMTDYFIPRLDKDEKTREFVKKFMTIDRFGVFFPVLIQEIRYLGNKFFIERPDVEIITEVNSLIDFLEVFAERETGAIDIPNSFRGNYMRSCIRIVASKNTREKGDISKHKHGLTEDIKDGFANIYVIGRSDDGNKSFIDEVIEAVLNEHSFIELIKSYQYKCQIKISGKYRSVETYLTHLHNPNAVQHLIKAVPKNLPLTAS